MFSPVPAGQCRNSLPSVSQRLLIFEIIGFVSKVVQGTYFVKDSRSSRRKKKKGKPKQGGKSLPFPPLVQLERVFFGLNCTSIGNSSSPCVCLERAPHGRLVLLSTSV